MLHNWLAWSVNPRKPSKDYSVNWRMRACFRAQTPAVFIQEASSVMTASQRCAQSLGRYAVIQICLSKNQAKRTICLSKRISKNQPKPQKTIKQKPTKASSKSQPLHLHLHLHLLLRLTLSKHLTALCELKRPDWLPEDAWRDGVSYRKTHKSRFTEKAAELSLCELAKLRERGFEPRAVIEQSILSGWTGL